MAGIMILIGFALAGILSGFSIVIPYAYSKYIAVAILACLDSVFGAITANLEKKFKINVFLSGFFGNALIAIFLTFIGQKLDVDIYLAAVIVFSGRLLNNFSTIRRILIGKFEMKKVEEQDSVEKTEIQEKIKKETKKALKKTTKQSKN